MSPPSTTVSFRVSALLAAVSAWALVAVGGVVRITESGLGCPDWPLCEGKIVPAGGTAPALEFSHRATAALVTFLVVVTAAWAWRGYRSRREILVPAIVAALFIPGEALLGAVVVWLELPGWIVGLHFGTGMLFLAATVATAVAAWPGRTWAPAQGLARLVWVTAGAGLLLVAAGTAVVSAHAGAACGKNWPACNGSFVAGGSEAELQVVHRSLAYVVTGLALALAVLAWRGRGPRLLCSLLLLAVLAQMAFGILLVLTGPGGSAYEPLGILHVAGAGTVWAFVVLLAARVGRLRKKRAETRLGAPVPGHILVEQLVAFPPAGSSRPTS